jgi:precorrin-6B methylase 1
VDGSSQITQDKVITGYKRVMRMFRNQKKKIKIIKLQDDDDDDDDD